MCCQTPIALVYAAIKVRAYLCRDTLSVDFAIFQIEVQTSNGLLGYRAMWRLLQTKYDFTVKRYAFI